MLGAGAKTQEHNTVGDGEETQEHNTLRVLETK
jgi:hypothetical protein